MGPPGAATDQCNATACTNGGGRLSCSGTCLGAGQIQRTTLHPSSDKNPAVWLFPWDLGGHSCSPNLFHTLVPNLFHIFILNNNGKPRCKRLNPRLRQVGPRQLVGELLRKGGVVSRVVSWAYWAIWAKVL